MAAAVKESLAAADVSNAEAQASGGLDLAKLEVQGNDTSQYSLPIVLLFAFVGGFVLNFMPCVLPVIGLKVLSFVQQAGADKRQAFMLNLWYSLGLMSIFVLLATMVGVFNQGWGTQSQDLTYQITMASVVFVMGFEFPRGVGNSDSRFRG